MVNLDLSKCRTVEDVEKVFADKGIKAKFQNAKKLIKEVEKANLKPVADRLRE